MVEFILLDDAAKEISKNTGCLFFGGPMHNELHRAASRGYIPAYNPLNGERVMPGEFEQRIWSTRQDLNKWLEHKEIAYRFTVQNGEGSDTAREPTNEREPTKLTSNELAFSGLLNDRKKKDDWYRVIDDMTRAFHTNAGKIPTKAQAWAQLWTNPPEGYEITTGTDRREDVLKMPGNSNLSKRAFNERWKGYTAQSQDKTF